MSVLDEDKNILSGSDSQLVERSLSAPAVHSSNPVILLTVNCVQNMKIKKKRPVETQFLQKESSQIKY